MYGLFEKHLFMQALFVEGLFAQGFVGHRILSHNCPKLTLKTIFREKTGFLGNLFPNGKLIPNLLGVSVRFNHFFAAIKKETATFNKF